MATKRNPEKKESVARLRGKEMWKADILATLSPANTILAVIDVQNDFCSADGALARLGYDLSPCVAVAAQITNTLPALRDVVSSTNFFRLVYDTTMMSAVQKERLLRGEKPVICDPAGTGTDLFLPTVATDCTFIKHRYSAFSNESFVKMLRIGKIETVLVAGVDTHICVEATVRQGYDMGFRMVVLSDLVGTHRREQDAHIQSLARMDRYFGFVAPSQVVIEALSRKMGRRRE